jgi:hypothetical protein
MENCNRCDIARRANRMRGALAATAPAVVILRFEADLRSALGQVCLGPQADI